MSTDDYDDNVEDQQEQEHQVTLSRKDIRALESKGKKFDEASAKAEKLERELAFARAGIDTESAAGKLLFKGYEGELTADGIQSFAKEAGFAATQSEETDDDKPDGPELEPGEAEYTDERRALAQGAVADTGQSADPYEEAIDTGLKARADGAKEGVVFGAAFNSVVNAANRGDKRVIIHRHGFRE